MSRRWACRLFGPGLSAGGDVALIEIAGEQILVYRSGPADGPPAGAQALAVAAADVRLRRVGADDRGLELAFTAPGPLRFAQEASASTAPAADQAACDAVPSGGRLTYACQVLDPGAARELLTALPAGAGLDRRVIEQYDRSQDIKLRLGLAALALFLLLPLLLLLLVFANLDGIAALVVDRITPSQEAEWAAPYREAFERDPTYRREGLRHRVVSDIGARLTATGARYDYMYFIAADPSLNAFALPGGLVVVNDGLIDATDRPEELAGVIAHEIQHVELRHGLRALVKEAGLAAAIALVTGDASGTLAGDLGRRLAGLKFSRDAERQADLTGLARLEQAAIDPAGMVTFFGTLAEQGGGAPVEWLSTHPASEARARRLREALARTSPVTRELWFSYLDAWPPPAHRAAP